jgi:DNA-binding response OmpR family regulator
MINRLPDLAKIESGKAEWQKFSVTRSEPVTKRILIVDDEPNIVAAVEFLLQQSGYEVHVANNGEQALELVESCIPDLVLLDVMMPKKSGYEVCTRIRERADWQHIKIIMLSAKGREAEVNKGLSLGADFYVTKPWSNKDLVAKIDELLGSEAKPGRT